MDEVDEDVAEGEVDEGDDDESMIMMPVVAVESAEPVLYVFVASVWFESLSRVDDDVVEDDVDDDAANKFNIQIQQQQQQN